MSVIFVQGVQEFDSGVCMRGLNLLGHAQMIEFSLGSQCGGHGKCGKDRVLLKPEDQGKVSDPSEIERIHLSAPQLAAGFRLACQCFPNEDELTIRVLLPAE